MSWFKGSPLSSAQRRVGVSDRWHLGSGPRPPNPLSGARLLCWGEGGAGQDDGTQLSLLTRCSYYTVTTVTCHLGLSLAGQPQVLCGAVACLATLGDSWCEFCSRSPFLLPLGRRHAHVGGRGHLSSQEGLAPPSECDLTNPGVLQTPGG